MTLDSKGMIDTKILKNLHDHSVKNIFEYVLACEIECWNIKVQVLIF